MELLPPEPGGGGGQVQGGQGGGGLRQEQEQGDHDIDVYVAHCFIANYMFVPRKIVRGVGGALSKDSAIELFDLNHKVATTNGSRPINIHNITEEELKKFFVNRCGVFGKNI